MIGERKVASVALGVFLLGTAAWVGGGAAVRPSDFSALRVPVLACTGSCTDYQRDDPECSTQTVGGHEYFNSGGSTYLDTETSEGCVLSFSCASDGHTTCGIQEEDLDAIELAVSTLRGPDLRRLIQGNREVMLWNQARHSVQVLGCGGGIVLSFLVHETQEASLADL